MVTKVGVYRDKRNKNRPWVVRWFGDFDPNKGKQRHYLKSFATKREAEDFQASKQNELNRGLPRDKPADITIAEFARRFLESKVRNRRAATRYNYTLTLDQFVTFVGPNTPIRRISPEIADRFVATRDRVAKIGRGYSPWSRNRHLVNIKIAFNAAVRWGYLPLNPFAHIKRERCAPRKWHHLKPAEFRALLHQVKDLRWQAFYLLAYTTGARFGELFNLTWADVDFDRQTVTIRDRTATAEMPPFHVKDHEMRTLLLPRQTVEALLAWQARAPEKVPYVLLTAERWQRVRTRWQLCHDRKPWKFSKRTGQLEWVEWENRHLVNNCIRNIRVHLRQAGVRTDAPMTIHTLRKSFGQNHAEAGTPIHVLQRLMGHASITTTREFYLQAADANERDAIARYESLLGKTCVRIAYEAGTEGETTNAASTTQSTSST